MTNVRPDERVSARSGRAGSVHGSVRIDLLFRDWKEPFVDQHGRLSEVGRLFKRVGPAEQIAVVPWARGDLEAKGQTAGVEAGGDYHGGNADHVDPSGIAV